MAQSGYITENFLLETEMARRLYHEYAAGMPIIDYHCHLPPQQIADDHRYRNMADVWLGGDHYKWRAMRANGVPERFCTGEAPDREKFRKWAETVPRLVRNQLYNWTHLELVRYFDIPDRLGPETAEQVWEAGNARLSEPGYSARGLMERSNVVLVCTTDDPADSLEHHRAVAEDESFNVQVLPTWRPDKGMAMENVSNFNDWVDKLAAAADTDIGSFAQYMEALGKRHDFFHEAGCRLSDHGIETAYAAECTDGEVAAVFDKARGGTQPGPDEILKFKSAMLYRFGVMDHARGWTQQFHFGALRNVNSRMFEQLGPDTGFDAIGDFEIGRPFARLLDRLAAGEHLAKTIVYNLNPRDNVMLVTLLGGFQDGTVPGKMQFGSGWWFLDQIDGMLRQMEDLSQNGLLSRFVGMLTDSRSFLSYTRHDYFRRILCNMLGNDVARGVIPDDVELLGTLVRDVSYNNAARYFGFDVPEA